MDPIEVFLTAFGGTTVALAIAAFLGKSLIGLQVSRAIEKYKSELEQRSAALKTELSIYAHEQQVGLSRIDEQRSKAIQAIYNLITQWHDAFLDITAPNDNFDITPEHEFNKFYGLSERIAKLSDKLSLSIRNHAIYFDEETYNTISNYGATLTDLGLQYYSDTFENLDIANNPDYAVIATTVRSARSKLFEGAKGNVDELRSTLLSEFRRLMKSESNKANE